MSLSASEPTINGPNGCVRIRLPRGLVAVVDEADSRLAAHGWRLHDGRSAAQKRDGAPHKWYARRRRDDRLLHREVLGLTDPRVGVDHVNGDGLDCRRANLRPAVATQNCVNRGASRNSRSGIKGVSWCSHRGLWRMDIRGAGRREYGWFGSIEDAARAYDRAARKLHGEFARLNFPEAA